MPLVYNAACRDRHLFRQEWDAARLAAEAASRLREELEGVKKVCADRQDKLLESERQKPSAEAPLEVPQAPQTTTPQTLLTIWMPVDN